MLREGPGPGRAGGLPVRRGGRPAGQAASVQQAPPLDPTAEQRGGRHHRHQAGAARTLQGLYKAGVNNYCRKILFSTQKKFTKALKHYK